MRAMDDIVENFLVQKLGKEIEAAKANAASCGHLVSIESDCKAVHDLIKEKKEETRAAVKETRREKLYNVLNLIAEWRQILEKKQPLKQLGSLDDIPRKLKQVKTELEEKLPKQAKTEVEEEKDTDKQVYRWSSHTGAPAEIHGFHDKIQIMERLLCRNRAVGIVGVAGVGKTALCQRAYNHPPVREHFPLRIWLCLSQKASFEDHLKTMLTSLGFEDQVIHKTKKLQLALRRHFTRGRYLLVLDDVWTADQEIQNLFHFLTLHPHHTLLLTSRSSQLLGPNNMHRLLPLADDESCWEIFGDAYKEEEPVMELTEELEKLKRNILDKCDGLPLMAKMLGKIRYHHDFKEQQQKDLEMN